MTERIFVDSNVLIYSRDLAVPKKQLRAREWMEYLWNSRRGRLSFQVLNEFYVTVTRKLRPGLKKVDARKDVRDLLAWKPAAIEETVSIRSWDLQDRYALSFWDSLIVGAAELQGCRYILTEDLNEGQEFFNIRIISPFLRTPQDL